MVDLPYVEVSAGLDKNAEDAKKCPTIEVKYDSYHKRILITVDLDNKAIGRHITYWFPVEKFRDAVEEAILNPAFTEDDFDENIGYYLKKLRNEQGYRSIKQTQPKEKKPKSYNGRFRTI
jgi:hypothetical protein